jgi:hypothetical protein
LTGLQAHDGLIQHPLYRYQHKHIVPSLVIKWNL